MSRSTVTMSHAHGRVCLLLAFWTHFFGSFAFFFITFLLHQPEAEEPNTCQSRAQNHSWMSSCVFCSCTTDYKIYERVLFTKIFSATLIWPRAFCALVSGPKTAQVLRKGYEIRPTKFKRRLKLDTKLCHMSTTDNISQQ